MDCGLGGPEKIPIQKVFKDAIKETEACNQSYFYNPEFKPEKPDKCEMDKSLRKLLDILKEQGINLSMYVANDCSQFMVDLLRNEQYKGNSYFKFRNTAWDLLASLLLLVTDTGYTKSQTCDYILGKWNREIKERTEGETNGNQRKTEIVGLY